MIETATKAAEATANGLKAFFSANAVVSIFYAGILQYLWGLINALQVIVLTDLFNIDVAPNAHIIMALILEMVSLDFIDTEDFVTEIFNFQETNPFASHYDPATGDNHSKFLAAGYDSSNFILLLGSMFIIMVLYIGINILRFVTLLACKPCGTNFLTKRLRKKNNWRVIVMRFMLESCLEIGLSAII